MARTTSTRRSVSLPKKLADFNNSSAGLDLTLRLIQALAQIASELCVDSATVIKCVTAKSQLALGEFTTISCSWSPFNFWSLTTMNRAKISPAVCFYRLF